ncbi:UDP-glucuronic acid decarboxylase 3 [Hibiscus syriacus]|uniref:UDP-glucuronic acid decarboxylase 3 n=1 Tax=Hibiscus syriacus TaxID=106335 RepID=A0A6A2X9M4_HIBSY|nr:UDP-glucuronic acid decarboxylase 3 [Hibiscus syriacus]
MHEHRQPACRQQFRSSSNPDQRRGVSVMYKSIKVDGVIRLMEGENTGPFHIGNPGYHIQVSSMLELAEAVKELINPDDPQQRKADITKAKELLVWEPTTVKLHDGLSLM